MARTAEEIGFDALWISDHLGFADGEGGWNGAWESWTLLSALAASTERVELGTYVSCAAFRNAGLFAKMAETLDEVSGGRVILGLGAGWNEPEFRAFDLPFERRFDRFEDTLRIVCGLLRDGHVDHAGRQVSARDASLAPRGPRPHGLPVMVGGSGPRTMRLTAELADHWNGGLAPIEEAPALLERLDAACAAVGRDPRTLDRSFEVLVRTVPAAGGTAADERELVGDPAALAGGIRRWEPFGLVHLQVQLRPNTVDAVRAFEPVLRELDGGVGRSTDHVRD
jgi:alkanesulfonate monooxygenase SsuD/methylene tetrahydromethanopterin reductase-like flavin-dependent oxidoreductase (luciferase family)